MTPPPTSIDGTDITAATIDGQDVQEITVDGETVFTAVTPPFIIEDWEDGDQQGWTVNAGTLVVDTNSPVFEGSFSGKVTKDNGGFAECTSLPGDGLKNYPDQFGTHQFRFSFDTTDENGFEYRFAVQDINLNDCYMVRAFDNGRFTIAIFTNGRFSQLASSNLTLSANTEFIGEIEHLSNGSITWTVKDANENVLNSVSTVDTTHQPNGISLNPNSGGGPVTVTFDEIKVTSVE